jgi:hypothetical protein
MLKSSRLFRGCPAGVLARSTHERISFMDAASSLASVEADITSKLHASCQKSSSDANHLLQSWACSFMTTNLLGADFVSKADGVLIMGSS